MDPTVRVLHVITRLELGGAQRNTLYTVASLDRSSFEPGLVWGTGDRLDGEARALEGVERFEEPSLVRRPSPARDLAALAALRGIIRRWQPRIVHTHSSKAGVVGRLAARLEGVSAIVHSIHGFGFTPLQPPPVRAAFLGLERLAARWTDAFIAVSHADARRGIELGLFDEERVRVIRSGIDLSRFRSVHGGSGLRARLGVPPRAPLVVQVANFKPQKAPLDFVRLAAAVHRRHPDAWFVLAGDGRLRRRVESAVADADLGGRVVLPGWVDDVGGLLDAADVAVLTSRHEGLPRSVVEALAAGVPVVATAVDGTPEVVRPAVNGFLAPPGDVEGMAGAVCRLLDEPGLWRRLSAAAAEGLGEFDINEMVRRQEALYRCLLSSTRT